MGRAPGAGFPSWRGSVKLERMSDAASMPPLPAGWPYPARQDGRSEERLERVSLPGLGADWTLHLRCPVPEGNVASELPGAFGRGGVRRFGDVVIRPYRRGGLVHHVNERIYMSSGRFAREASVHRALWDAGFPTVEPLGYGYRSRLWGVEGIYLTRYVEAIPWPACWDRSPSVVPRVAQLVDFLAAWGLHAPDLNATNFLVAADDRVLALDWDRSGWTQATDLRARYAERLLRSLRKLGAPDGVLLLVQRAFR